MGASASFRRGFPPITVECAQGDIADQPDMDAVVNAANAPLAPGAGVAGEIHTGAGAELYEACKPLAPIEPGQAVATPAFDLPNNWVIHCLGPIFGADEPAAALLALCYQNAMRIADELGATSLATPAISTGVFGYPIEEAASVAMTAVRQQAPCCASLRLVRFVLWSEEDRDIHADALRALA